MKNKFFLLFIFTILIAGSSISNAQGRIDLGGAWQFRKAGTQQWYPATVPGCVHTDLMKNKLIPDPYYRDNEKQVQWVGEIGWEYKKDFNVSDTLFRLRHVELVCEGLDTYANVFINDTLLIVAENMFREWFADIRPFLKIGKNTLRIQFPDMNKENAERYQKLPARLPGDEKVVCRKAGYQFGWDWGPKLITTGIWKPIYMRTWTYNHLLGVQYIQNSLSDTAAQMTAVFTILSGLADTAVVKVYNGKELLLTGRAPLKRGVTVYRTNFTIRNPKLWWTNGLGEHPLYKLDHELWFAGRKEATGFKKIGLRTLELVQKQDSTGRTFYFKLNGIPVFMKGANYIPQDNFVTRVSDSSYREIIRSAADANMNMLRVWGGGIYEKDIFYDLCDENGILVWQDFMFANAMYPDEQLFMSNIQGEVIQNIVRLRHHPCLSLWCGNNEIEEAWRNWGWAKEYGYSDKDSTRVWNGYRIIFRNLIAQQVARFDTLRPYISTSPAFGWGREESYSYGDSHYWGVWWGKEPFSKYTERIGRFVSEYGFQGFPPYESIKKFTLPQDRVAGSEVMKAHQKHPAGYQIIDEYMNRDYRRPKDLESYAYVSMLLQARGMKIAVDAHRSSKPWCMGTLYWQFNDCWPVVSWSMRDYYGNKKAAWYMAKRKYETCIISPFSKNDSLNLCVVSDSLKDISGKLVMQLMDFSGTILENQTLDVTIPANSATMQAKISEVDWLKLRSRSKVVALFRLISGEKVVAEEIHYFTNPEDLWLDIPQVTKKIAPVKGGYMVTLRSNVLARDVYLSYSGKGDFSDNFFDILPGQTRTVFFRTKAKDAAFLQNLKIRTLRDTYTE